MLSVVYLYDISTRNHWECFCVTFLEIKRRYMGCPEIRVFLLKYRGLTIGPIGTKLSEQPLKGLDMKILIATVIALLAACGTSIIKSPAPTTNGGVKCIQQFCAQGYHWNDGQCACVLDH